MYPLPQKPLDAMIDATHFHSCSPDICGSGALFSAGCLSLYCPLQWLIHIHLPVWSVLQAHTFMAQQLPMDAWSHLCPWRQLNDVGFIHMAALFTPSLSVVFTLSLGNLILSLKHEQQTVDLRRLFALQQLQLYFTCRRLLYLTWKCTHAFVFEVLSLSVYVCVCVVACCHTMMVYISMLK